MLFSVQILPGFFPCSLVLSSELLISYSLRLSTCYWGRGSFSQCCLVIVAVSRSPGHAFGSVYQ